MKDTIHTEDNSMGKDTRFTEESVCTEPAESAAPENDPVPEKGGKRRSKLTKKGRRKLALAILIAVFSALALIVGISAPVIAVGNDVVVEDSAVPNAALTSWQSYISDSALIVDMAIPGSHDAACIEMPWYGSTQTLSVYDQLMRGVRYLDIRVNKTSDGLVIFHSVVNGIQYSRVLDDIARFMDEHPTEFVIIDFQYFKNGSEEQVFAMLDETVHAEKVVNDGTLSDLDFVNSLTLGDVRGKVLVLATDESDYDGRDYIFRRAESSSVNPDTVLYSPYNRSKSIAVTNSYIEKTLPYYLDAVNGIRDGLTVLQAQRTDAIGLRGPRMLEAKAEEGISDFVLSLAESDKLDGVNIVMRDFITCKKTAEIVLLNLAKGLVVEAQAEDFRTAVSENLA